MDEHEIYGGMMCVVLASICVSILLLGIICGFCGMMLGLNWFLCFTCGFFGSAIGWIVAIILLKSLIR